MVNWKTNRVRRDPVSRNEMVRGLRTISQHLTEEKSRFLRLIIRFKNYETNDSVEITLSRLEFPTSPTVFGTETIELLRISIEIISVRSRTKHRRYTNGLYERSQTMINRVSVSITLLGIPRHARGTGHVRERLRTRVRRRFHANLCQSNDRSF